MSGVDAIIVMGVSGSGKSSVGPLLAETLDARFIEGDDFHPPENVAKMRAGIALTDEDRRPWLDRICEAAEQVTAEGRKAVIACSALKRRYRDRLAVALDGHIAFVLLDGDRASLARRVADRPGHYMPAQLVDSQLATLEMPDPDERALVLGAGERPEEIAAQVCRWLARQEGDAV